jgi:hypothetical protein
MSRTHVYAVATITPKALSRLLTLNLLPRCAYNNWFDAAHSGKYVVSAA